MVDYPYIETSHTSRVQFVQNNRFAGDFKAGFHRIRYLHSVAIVGLHFSEISTVEPRRTRSKLADSDVAKMVKRLWMFLLI